MVKTIAPVLHMSPKGLLESRDSTLRSSHGQTGQESRRYHRRRERHRSRDGGGFAGEGAAVVIGDLNLEGGEAAVRQCKENGGRAVFQKCDVQTESDIKALIDRALSEFGKLDIIFNNAGLGGAVGTIEETSVENWDKTQAILLRAVFIGMKYAVPAMKKSGGGSIISTASVAGLRGGAGPHSYSAAKAAVINLTRSVALEVGEHKIRVNCICPGGISTPLLHNFIPGGK